MKMKKLLGCIVMLLSSCSSNDMDSFNSQIVEKELDGTNVLNVLPEQKIVIPEKEFLAKFSGSWHLYDLSNCMMDGTEINRKKDFVDGHIVDVRLFENMLGGTVSSFDVNKNNQLIEKKVTTVNGKETKYYEGNFCYDEQEGLLTIHTGSSSEIDGVHRVMQITDDELVISGLPYYSSMYPKAIYAIYYYRHSP